MVMFDDNFNVVESGNLVIKDFETLIAKLGHLRGEWTGIGSDYVHFYYRGLGNGVLIWERFSGKFRYQGTYEECMVFKNAIHPKYIPHYLSDDPHSMSSLVRK